MLQFLSDFTISVVQMVILLAPFFVLSIFATLTEKCSLSKRKKIAVRSTIAIIVLSLGVYFLGEFVFRYLGITLDAFRVGAGTVLFLSGLEMVRGAPSIPSNNDTISDSNDIAVVPIAIPCAVGPGTIGALMVLSDNNMSVGHYFFDIFSIIFAVLFVGVILYFTTHIEHLIKKKGLTILSKLTGLFLVALATQIITEGIKGILK